MKNFTLFTLIAMLVAPSVNYAASGNVEHAYTSVRHQIHLIEYLKGLELKKGVKYPSFEKDLKGISIGLEEGKLLNDVDFYPDANGVELVGIGPNLSERKNASSNSRKATTTKTIQEITLKGLVKDASSGMPLIGATIKVLEGSTGVTTDIDGNFSIEIENVDNLKLEVSYIGYETKVVEYKGESFLEIMLAPSSVELDQVVVVGYGTRSKKGLAGSVGVVTSDEIKEVPVSSVDQVLQGRIAGVQVVQNSAAPGGAVSVRVRGNTSITANDPLYVIDGVPIYTNSESSAALSSSSGGGQGQNPLSNLNPADIESISVLKDAAASIYGARAANGVVIITTKSGKEGKLKLAYDNYFGVQEITKTIPVLNTTQFVDFQTAARRGANPNAAPYQGDNSLPYAVPNFAFPGNEFLNLVDGTTDWQDELFRQAFMQSHNVNVSGGKNGFVYSSSLSYFDQEGIVENSDFQRMSGKINLSKRFKDKFTVSANFNYGRVESSIVPTDGTLGTTGAVIGPALTFLPFVPVRGDSVVRGQQLYNLGQPQAFASITNPLIGINLNENSNISDRFIGYVDFSYEITDNLVFKTNYNWNRVDDTGELTNYRYFERVGPVANQSSFWRQKLVETTRLIESNLQYSKRFSDDVKLSALAGFSYQETESTLSFTSWGMFTDFANPANPNDISVNLADAEEVVVNPDQLNQFKMRSYYSRLVVDLYNKLSIEGIVRADESSRFAPNNRLGVFPSILVSYRLSEEPFLANFEKISNLKLRASYGILGNQEIGNYNWQSLLRQPLDFFILNGERLPATFNIQPANNNLKWEETSTLNVGLDLSLFNGRIQSSFEYYIKETKDVLFGTPPNVHLGLTTVVQGANSLPFRNLGEVKNRGFEVLISTVNFDKEKFKWTSDFNIARNTNELVRLEGIGENGKVEQNRNNGRGGQTLLQLGEPLGNFYGLKTDGVFLNQDEVDAYSNQDGELIQPNAQAGDIRYVDVNGDGIISEEGDRTIIGNGNPDLIFGFNNRLSYKNLELSFFFQGQFGNELYNDSRRFTEDLTGQHNQTTNVLNRWISEEQPGNGEVPRATSGTTDNNLRYTDRWIEDGSFIRLRNVTVSYTLPTSITSKLKASFLKVYVTGQNLWIRTDYSGFDPEVNSNGGSALFPGYDIGGYPRSKALLVGLNVSF